MNQHITRVCTECGREVSHYLNRGRCKTCYARLYRAVIQSESSRTKGIEYRKEYRKLNRERINKYWQNKRSKARAAVRKHELLYGRKKYARSPEYIAQVKEQQRLINEYKMEHGCVDCGYSKHPYALDFDHLRDKKYNIGSLARSRCSPETLWSEIAKCEIRCANCHRIKTHERRMTLAVEVLQLT